MQSIHLFVLVHGLWGGAGHLKAIEDTLDKYITESEEKVHILRPRTSALFKTYDGIEIIGQRMLLEVLKEIKVLNNKQTTVTKISFVGYSLGGLISRYIIGELEDLGIFKVIEPQFFATFATPHVGTWFFKRKFSILNVLGSRLLGLVGKELFITDDQHICLELSRGRYIDGLKRFKKRYIFSNVRHDRTVNFYTAFITNKNPFDQHWETLDLSFEFNNEILPTYEIRGVVVQPKIVNLNESTFRPVGYKKEKPSLFKKLRYIGILFLVTLILPIWIPFIVTASSIGSLVSYVIVKTYKKPEVDELKHLLPPNSRPFTDDVDLRERLEEVTNEALENAINLSQYDESTESTRDGSATISDSKKDDDVIKQDEESLERTFTNLIRYRDDNFKNPNIDDYEIFQKTEELPLDEARKQIIANLSELDWYKFAVYVNVLNAHDGIVARKGLKRSTVKGIAIISFFVQMVNRDIKELNSLKN